MQKEGWARSSVAGTSNSPRNLCCRSGSVPLASISSISSELIRPSTSFSSNWSQVLQIVSRQRL